MRRALFPLAVALAVATGTLLPGAGAPTTGGLPWDKLLHALGGAALVLACAWATRRRDGRALLALVVAVALFGGLLELAQSLLATRDPALGDFLADAVGAALGALLARLVLTRASPGP